MSDHAIDLKKHIAKGTGFHTTAAYLAALIIFIVAVVATMGIALIFPIVGWMFSYFRDRKAMAHLKGSSLQVGPQQFTEIYESAERMSQRLGLKGCPNVFIAEDNTQNAKALKIGSKANVVLIDDLVFGTEATGNPEALDFVIGHELAHHALGHTGALRGKISAVYPKLSRLDEFSCDSVATELAGSKQAAYDALALLLIGPQLFSKVNHTALAEQAEAVCNDKVTKRAEKTMSHPVLLRRLGAVMKSQVLGTSEVLDLKPLVSTRDLEDDHSRWDPSSKG